MFHALTGRDAVSGFAGYGKRIAWEAFPEALSEVNHKQTDIAVMYEHHCKIRNFDV